jgi:tryptophan synthase alpha chain
MTDRITQTFQCLKQQSRKGFVAFITAGDPDATTSLQIMQGLPAAGVDIIELGMPFSDPMADGPAIQLAGERAIAAGMTLSKVLDMVRQFRTANQATPIVLMGYYNPIHAYDREKFLADAKLAGVDGLIIVDLPPEEDGELCLPAQRHGVHFIRLVTPTTDAARLRTILRNASGFLYYVSVAGITGTKQASEEPVRQAMAMIRSQTDLPIAVGFGISTPERVKALGQLADAVVVGSAIVNQIAGQIEATGKAKPGLVDNTLKFVRTLAG